MVCTKVFSQLDQRYFPILKSKIRSQFIKKYTDSTITFIFKTFFPFSIHLYLNFQSCSHLLCYHIMLQVFEQVLMEVPGLLFFSTYTLLVLFWAEIYHQVYQLSFNRVQITKNIFASNYIQFMCLKCISG